MLSVEIIDQLRQEEERRRRQTEVPLRMPVDMPPDHVPDVEVEKAASEKSTVVVLDVSKDDVEEFRIATW